MVNEICHARWSHTNLYAQVRLCIEAALQISLLLRVSLLMMLIILLIHYGGDWYILVLLVLMLLGLA